MKSNCKSNFKCKACGNVQGMSPEADLDFETCDGCGECGEWLMVRAKAEVVEEAETMLPAKLETLTAIELFDTSKIKEVVNFVTEKAREHKPDTSTDKGRKAIASNAAQVSRSKTWLESIGKPASAKIKDEAKTLDASRKYMKDTLDALRDEQREPLTKWEKDEKIRVAAEALAEEIAADHAAALAENDLFDRAREIERKEAKFAKEEEDRATKAREAEEKKQAKIAADKMKEEEAEREKERQAQAKKDAEAEAAKKIAKAKAAEEEAKATAKEAAAKAEREKVEAAKKAEADKKAAVAEVERKAAQKEFARIAKEKADKAAADKLAANKKHRAKIDNDATEAIIKICGLPAVSAAKVVAALSAGNIPNAAINYHEAPK